MKHFTEAEPNISWNRLTVLTIECYWNINFQKEVSDRIHSLRYAYFTTMVEDPVTTVGLIKAYNDKHVPIALKSNRTDAARARFSSNAIRRTTLADHVKARMYASVTYNRMDQALQTSIPDETEFEEGLAMNHHSKRGSHHRRSIYRTRERRKINSESEGDEEPETYFREQTTADKIIEALETFFGSSRFARSPQHFKFDVGYNTNYKTASTGGGNASDSASRNSVTVG